MIQNIKAFIVLLIIVTLAFQFMKSACLGYIDKSLMNQKRNTWLLITAAAYFSFNFWVYCIFAFVILKKAMKYENNPAALFVFVLFAVPLGTVIVPGFGLINYFLYLDHARVLSLIILLPTFLSISSKKNTVSFGKTWVDRLVVAYFAIILIGNLRVGSFTSVLRECTYFFLDVFLPYFVFSRSLTSFEQFKEVINNFIFALTILAVVAVFESARNWLLYSCLNASLNFNTLFDMYLQRDGLLRAQASARQPIVLGYLMSIGLCLFVFFKQHIKSSTKQKLWLIILLLGLIVPFSRGPWLGSLFMMIIFYISGKQPMQKIAKVLIFSSILVSFLYVIPGGERVINMLPFVGKTEKGTIEYRQLLVENAFKVANMNPLFGSPDYLDTPEMQEMIQGQGIVDLVNTYIQKLLPNGYVGLSIFILIFVITIIAVYKSINRLRVMKEIDVKLLLLGKAICIALIGTMVVIGTTSSISYIAWTYWILLGIGTSYAFLASETYKNKTQK